MKFGWNCSSWVAPGEDLNTIVRLAQAMEAVGFSTFWYGEHMLMPHKFDVASYPYAAFPSHNAWPDVFVLLAAVAASTRSIRLGPAVAIVPLRPPVLLAQAVATVDALSNGRLLFGAGVGWMREEFEAMGIPFTERGARTTDSIRIMQALWTGKVPDFKSRFYVMPEGDLQPLPVQKPYPPIIVGGEGAPAMKRIVAYGDGWQFIDKPLPELRAMLDELKALMNEAGRSMSELELSMSCEPQYAIAHRDDFAAYEALGIKEICLRMTYRSAGEALANVEGIARELIG